MMAKGKKMHIVQPSISKHMGWKKSVFVRACVHTYAHIKSQKEECGKKMLKTKKIKKILLYIKCMTNKNLLYSTGNSTQYSVMAYMGKESKKKKSGYMHN